MNVFIELYQHGRLANSRHPMYDQNKIGQYMMIAGSIVWASYLILIGVMLAFAFVADNLEPYHLLNGGLLFLLVLDFMERVPLQKTPTQQMKPYLLLPVKRSRLLQFMLTKSVFSGFNFIWLFLFVPFAILTVLRFYGWQGVVLYNLGVYLLILLNNYWYLFCRTLMGEKMIWSLLPLGVYGALIAAAFIPEESVVFDFFVLLGDWLITGNVFAYLVLLALIVGAWKVNEKLMTRVFYNELNKVEDTKVKHVSDFAFLNRFGEVGEYIRLELHLLFRNKAPRNSVSIILAIVLTFSCLLAFTEVYDAAGMKTFIIAYNYGAFALVMLLPIMGYEGNYIDGLMTRKQSVLTLLTAKYIVAVIATGLPFLLTSPAVIMGKMSLLTSAAWAFFAMGVIYFAFFQLAIYNCSTVPLNLKVSGSKGQTSAIQLVYTFGIFIVPGGLYTCLNLAFNQQIAEWIMLVIGLVFVVLSPYWLKNIYNRLMKRKYRNLEGFRNSRGGNK